VNKIQKNARTRLADISTVGLELPEEQLGMAVGGMVCKEGMHPTTTRSLNEQGQSDTQSDCSG